MGRRPSAFSFKDNKDLLLSDHPRTGSARLYKHAPNP